MFGFRDHGQVTGFFNGRLANVALWQGTLTADEAQALANSVDNPTGLNVASLTALTDEFKDRFRRDLARLREWAETAQLTLNQMDDASLLVFRWLFDRHPLLVEICKSLGIQLWLPGSTADLRDAVPRFLDVDWSCSAFERKF